MAPAAPGDYEHLDPFAAELAFELVTVFRTTHQTSSDFLREHMAHPQAPGCIAGNPDDRRAFEGAKRAMSRRVGRTAREIPEWDLVEFVLARCGLDDDARVERLAGLWIVRNGVLPPVDVLQNVLEPHSITLQVAHPLMAELTPEEGKGCEQQELPENRENRADVHRLEVLGGEHRAGVLAKPVNVVDLIQNLTRRPGDTA